MQGWSRMAALTLVAALTSTLALVPRIAHAFDDAPKQRPAVQGKVTLNLVITGLKTGSQGSEVEIRPGNGASSFKPQVCKIPAGDDSFVQLKINELLISTTSPDRDCSLTITLKETGQTERFTRRGFRLNSDASTKPQVMTYYLNSTALASKVDTDRKTK